MPSLLPGYEYDIFISYRQNDNRSGWVTEFVNALQDELAATLKDPVSIYFDSNPHNGLHETHDVDGSLKEKVKCLVFIPIVSQTYCDPKSFAWQNEFIPYVEFARSDDVGLDVKVSRGNITKRVLPVRIHDIDSEDQKLFEEQIGGVLRPVDFIYREAGVNRPLVPSDDKNDNINRTDYRNQVNKVAHAVKEIIDGLIRAGGESKTDNQVPGERTTVAEKVIKKRKKPIRLPRFSRTGILGFVLTLFMIGFLLILFLWISERNAPRKTIHASILPPDKLNFRVNGLNFEISPNGEYIAFVAIDSLGRRSLWIRPLDKPNSYRLDGTDDAAFPFWSPNSKQLAFFANNELKKISITGGGVIPLVEVGAARGGSWSKDGKIIFNRYSRGPLYMIPDSGGTPVQLTQLDSTKKERSHRWPYFLPDGKHFLFTTTHDGASRSGDGIYVGSLDSSFTPQLIKSVSSNAKYMEGFLLFTKDQSLIAQPMSLDGFKLNGDPITILDGLYHEYSNVSGAFSISNTGYMLYKKGQTDLQALTYFSWVDREGQQLGSISQNLLSYYSNVRLSPGDDKLAVSLYIGGSGIPNALWSYDLDRSIWSKLTFSENSIRHPVWNIRGKRILYSEFTSDSTYIYEINSDGSGEPKLIYSVPGRILTSDLSSDGKYLLFDNQDIMILSMDGKQELKSFLSTGFNEGRAVFSPDGRWIAYQSDESGQYEIYIQSFDGQMKRKISRDGGSHPRWREDGKELFFLAEDRTIMSAIEINTGGNSVELGEEESLFQFRSIGGNGSDIYDVTKDGKRFILTTERNYVQTPLELVINWKELLKEK